MISSSKQRKVIDGTQPRRLDHYQFTLELFLLIQFEECSSRQKVATMSKVGR